MDVWRQGVRPRPRDEIVGQDMTEGIDGCVDVAQEYVVIAASARVGMSSRWSRIVIILMFACGKHRGG